MQIKVALGWKDLSWRELVHIYVSKAKNNFKIVLIEGYQKKTKEKKNKKQSCNAKVIQ